MHEQSLADLRQEAKALGIKSVTTYRKAQLIALINEKKGSSAPAAKEGSASLEQEEKRTAPKKKPAVKKAEAPKKADYTDGETEIAVITDTKRNEEYKQRKHHENAEAESSAAPHGETADCEGVLEVMPDGYGFLRCENYLPGSDDIYVSNTLIRKFCLKTGDLINGKAKQAREAERYKALVYINSINNDGIEACLKRVPFEKLTPVYPNERFRLESPGKISDLSIRVLDLVAPIGKGQRGLIVAPPKAGKTTFLKALANSIIENNDKIKLIVLLIDERPEEVTDMQRSVKGEVIYSTFDELPEHHARVAEMALARAQRLCEHKEDVVILMDSLTRLARAYNLIIPNSGRTLSGGIDPAALYKPKHFFGNARNIEEGGSITIIASALVETGSRMDDVIYEEFKGTGNMEMHLSRELAEKRIFPAIDIEKSSTRKEELLFTPEEMECSYNLRKMITQSSIAENTENILSMIKKTSSNKEFALRFKEWLKIMDGKKL